MKHEFLELVQNLKTIKYLSKSIFSPGDSVFICTNNPSYYLDYVGDGLFRITGGWFDEFGLSPHSIYLF
jgi:hypothetical protein